MCIDNVQAVLIQSRQQHSLREGRSHFSGDIAGKAGEGLECASSPEKEN